MKVVTIFNNKGGVGKTTLTFHLGSILAELGKKILLIDMDPQCNATSGLAIESERGIYEVLVDQIPLSEAIKETKITGLKIAPATMNLAGAAVELVNIDNREFVLRQSVMEVSSNFDYILIDCPPSLGLITINSLIAADDILIPVQAEYYALEGLGKLLGTIELIKENIKPELNVLGAVVTMYDKRNNLADQVKQDLIENFPYKVFKTIIPRNVRITEAPSHGLPISEYDRYSKGGIAYEMLAQEILDTRQ